jgi:hypothetical protein
MACDSFVKRKIRAESQPIERADCTNRAPSRAPDCLDDKRRLELANDTCQAL